MYYETSGNDTGPPVLLLHGIGADHNMFASQIVYLTAKGFRVIAPDLRGHGKSGKVKSLHLDDWAKDILELLDHLKIDQVNLLGISMGGVIALHFAVMYQSKVKSLIVADTFAELSSVIEKTIAKTQVLWFRIFKFLPSSMAAGMVASAYKKISREAETYFREVTLSADFSQLVLARKAINKINVTDQLKNINFPALVIVGDKVRFMIPVNRKIADAIPQSEFHVVKNSMDPSNMVAPDKFNQLISGFLTNRINNY